MSYPGTHPNSKRDRLPRRRLFLALASVSALVVGVLAIGSLAATVVASPAPEGVSLLIAPAPEAQTPLRLPLAVRSKPAPPPTPVACQITGSTYGTLSVASAPTDRPAAQHADLNLALRGYRPTSAALGLVHYNPGQGGPDGGAPQLPTLFANQRTATITAAHQVYDWNWDSNSRGYPLVGSGVPPDLFGVTLVDLATTPGETLHSPRSGYDIGSGYQVLVLYAAEDRITLKYTREDNVRYGYAIHLERICTDPSLLALYQARNSAGRGSLPALTAQQPLGRARGTSVGVAVRDSGMFMDPRSQTDWWQGRGPVVVYLANPLDR